MVSSSLLISLQLTEKCDICDHRQLKTKIKRSPHALKLSCECVKLLQEEVDEARKPGKGISDTMIATVVELAYTEVFFA